MTNIEPIKIEPDSGWLKNTYLKFLGRCGYLSIFEGYKFTMRFNQNLEDIDEGKDFVEFIGMNMSSVIGYKKERVKDGKNIEFFVKFLLPLDDFNFRVISRNNTPIYKSKIPLKFTTLFTPNNVILMIFMTIISTLISMVMN